MVSLMYYIRFKHDLFFLELEIEPVESVIRTIFKPFVEVFERIPLQC